MKISHSKIRRRGMALVTTLVLALLVAIVVGALLLVAQQQNYITSRSRVWASEIPLAEAGIEEAMAHINSRPTNWAANGWSLVSSNYVKSRTLGDDYFYAAISTSRPPRIISVGYGRIPLQTNYSHRTVMVTTRSVSGGYGVVSRTTVSMSGGSWVDSFDSSDPTYSTAGLYDPAKRKDNGFVASIASTANAVDTGTGIIYGNVATGPGGTASGNVGDGTWLASNSGIQAGHFRNDFNMAIPDVAIPYATGNPLPAPVANIYTLTTGDYKETSSLNIGGGKGIIVAGPGKVRVYFTSDFTTSGSGFITIQSGASLELYLGGKGTISGSAIVNSNQTPSTCAIFGLPTCSRIDYTGDSAYIGTLYAPQAAATFSGSAGASGSFVANSFVMSGGMNIHYDEAGSAGGVPFQITSWEELRQ